MDQGGREYMKFMLKEGLVYIVENDGLYNNNIEAEVEAPGLEEFAIEYKVNDSEYRKVENHLMVIPKEFLKATRVKLVFRAIKDKEIKYFESDAIPLTQAVVFGGTIDTYYPKIIREVLRNIEQVNEAMQVLKDFAERKADETQFSLGQVMLETKKDLKQTMLELVDTFEEITKKGSLF
jgi:uncharacterized membrane-anchored protein YjiN (DUF445 family)